MKELSWFENNEKRIPAGEVRTRFAPSPTGYMHVGNLRTALYTYLIARHEHGKFILRIEDTDRGRLIEGATDVIYRTMAECHLDHDEGPDVGGPVAPYIQSERMSMYKEYAELLVEKGCAYRCFCEKAESEEDSGEFDRADDPCRAMAREESDAKAAAGEPYVIRQRIPHEGTTTFHDEIFGDITVENKTLDDQVLIKRDGMPTYNFANVVDDHLMGITHVVRGSEYLSSAPKYNLLYEGFGWAIPKYVHCSPVMRDAHNKMSKRHGDPSYEDLIAQGYLTDAVINYVALLGWSPGGEQEIFSLDELVPLFDISKCSKAGAKFAYDKGIWFNHEYILMKSAEEIAQLFFPIVKEHCPDETLERVTAVTAMMKDRVSFVKELWPLCSFFFEAPTEYDEKTVKKRWKEDSAAQLTELITVLEGIDDFSLENQEQIVHAWIEQKEYKLGNIMNAWRLTLVGEGKGPGMFDISAFLGKEETIRRMKRAIEVLSE